MSTPSNEQRVADGDESGDVMTNFARRAPRISQVDVFRAADELLVQGDRPTIDRVRMRLGRGSPNTINDHLDAWWAKLGARLRDLPGQEFPQLPERVAHSLQQLWNEALAGAHEALQGALAERERSLLQREADLRQAAQQLAERERAVLARATALEDGLTLAREQLTASNQRAATLEARLQGCDEDIGRLRRELGRWQATAGEAQTRFEAATADHAIERAELQERAAAAERHWMLELDRTRQGTREAAKEHEQQHKAMRQRVATLEDERDELRGEVSALRADCQTHRAIREQLEGQLRALEPRADSRAHGGGGGKRPQAIATPRQVPKAPHSSRKSRK